MYCEVKGHVLLYKKVYITKNLFFIFFAITFNISHKLLMDKDYGDKIADSMTATSRNFL